MAERLDLTPSPQNSLKRPLITIAFNYIKVLLAPVKANLMQTLIAIKHVEMDSIKGTLIV